MNGLMKKKTNKRLEHILKQFKILGPFNAIHQYRNLRNQAKDDEERDDLDNAFGQVYDRDFCPGSFVLIGGDRLYIGMVPGGEEAGSRIPDGVHLTEDDDNLICVLEGSGENLKSMPVAIRYDGVLECLGFLHHDEDGIGIYRELSYRERIQVIGPDEYSICPLTPRRLDRKNERG